MIEDNFDGVIDDDVDDRGRLFTIVSTDSFGGIGSGQCVVPVTEMISLPRRPSGLARVSSCWVKSLMD